MSRFSQIAIIASREAWEMSGLELNDDISKRTGVIAGAGLGSVESTDLFYEGLVRRGPHETNPMIFPETVQNIAAAHISIELGIKGPNTTFSQGDIAGESAVFYATGLLRKKTADAVIVCGVDELTAPLLLGLSSLKLLSVTDTLAPFDNKRDGIIPAEGAASVVIERAEDAGNRGANILGYINAFGTGSDSVGRFSYASPESMSLTIDSALNKAGISPDFISASANSTVELDRNEAIAIKSSLGRTVPVTAVKSQIGSFMASGVMKLTASLISIREGVIPPIFGLDDPEIPGLNYIMNQPVSADIDSCLINGFSHGGSKVCMIVTGSGREEKG
ncbi:3-oxoacyl-[acyl-carrier-protein] synthase 2 [bacterium BMS3Abin07]|nr:3-oxoacyl-[acyl-carrier-protein] synthase 2 [bacterium BMS3Abin07]GBE32764.1 3-oxoacyl-[acyl-carrier-protein] synthase 2 [bacterium BMS3Bbin05]HDO22385.1 hypothetical protein [Nitrospirota bacterium]HDZ87825.1 hypothetical protein [Nitrospirota bacterium]